MRALIADPQAAGGVRLGDAEDPLPAPTEALVEVKAVSLNYGELRDTRGLTPGTIPGWDAAGVVVSAAEDGSGPRVGTPVVTFGPHPAWAQLRAVPTGELAPLPPEVDFAQAATLPVAGLSALQALRRLGFVAGERILVTGAAGGVGRFAVQLAALAGAHVIAVAGSPARAEGLAGLGAAQVVTDLAEVTEPVFGALDSVGGPTLVTAYGLLAEGGTVISLGGASGEPAVFPPYATVGPGRRIESYLGSVDAGSSRDLATLIRFVAEGRLTPQIGWRGGWDRVAEAAEALYGRKVNGKAVLDVS
ncbi:MAG: zinc-binding dehydrogenase [Hamadaea sp.]|nr:zinc-binding dehydrogenase [Hamadaea sp.]